MKHAITKTVFVYLLYLISPFCHAQEVKFGKVSVEELSETEYIHDKSAAAAVLYKDQETFFYSSGENTLRTNIHERIKIYNKEGFDYATKQINLFRGRQDKESVNKIKAFTYNLENGKVVKTELDKDQIFKTEAGYNYDQVKFTMPNVKVGSVIEFTYQIVSPFIWNIDEFRFQYDIPIKRLHAELKTPEGFNFKQTVKGSVLFYPKKSTNMDSRVNMKMVTNTYNLNNVPALKEESYVDNIQNYRSGVMFELVSIKLPGYYKSYSQTWSDVAKTIGNSDDYENKLDKTKAFNEELDQIIASEPDPMSKMKAVFKYVKENITWNEMDGKYFYNGIKKTLKEKKGNAADINLTLVGMLRYAGLDANPVIISTKDNSIPIVPTIERLNYVVAYVEHDGKKYFLDATEEYSDINVLPIRDYNWRGILIDNNRMKWELIDLREPNQAVRMVSLKSVLDENGTAEGKVQARHSEHRAMEFRESFNAVDQDTYLTELETLYKGIEISNYEAKNTESYEGAVTESFEFFDENASENIDGKLYVQPMSFLARSENPFKLEERQYPVDFGYSFKNKYMIDIQIPAGYKIEFVPESILLKLPIDMGEFKYVVNHKGNMVKLLVDYEIKNAVVSPVHYAELKEFYNQMHIKQAEQIVLVKE